MLALGRCGTECEPIVHASERASELAKEIQLEVSFLQMNSQVLTAAAVELPRARLSLGER